MSKQHACIFLSHAESRETHRAEILSERMPGTIVNKMTTIWYLGFI